MDYTFAEQHMKSDAPMYGVRLKASGNYAFSAGNLPDGHLGATFLYFYNMPDEAAWYVPATGILWLNIEFAAFKAMADASDVVYTMATHSTGSNACLTLLDLEAVRNGWVQAYTEDGVGPKLATLDIDYIDNSRHWNCHSLFDVKGVKAALDTFYARHFEMECVTSAWLNVDQEAAAPHPTVEEQIIYERERAIQREKAANARSIISSYHRRGNACD